MIPVYCDLALFNECMVLMRANGKMRTCGDAGLQFRVSRVRV